MRAAATSCGLVPVVPPKSNRRVKWNYDKEIYKKRNEVERFFLRIKRYRRVATRYDKFADLQDDVKSIEVLKCGSENIISADAPEREPKRVQIISL